MQQAMAEHLAQQSSDEGRRTAANRRAIALDRKGILDQMDATPDAQRPSWIPADPMDPAFDPWSVEEQVQAIHNRGGSWTGITP